MSKVLKVFRLPSSSKHGTVLALDADLAAWAQNLWDETGCRSLVVLARNNPFSSPLVFDLGRAFMTGFDHPSTQLQYSFLQYCIVSWGFKLAPKCG